jgi:hypothetical protein
MVRRKSKIPNGASHMAISRWLSTVSSLVIAGMFAAGNAGAQGTPKIGVASAVKNRVDGTIGGSSRPLVAGSDVFSRQVVSTGQDSAAQLLFLDETSLSIGPQSEITLDRFVYDPNRGAGNVVVNATRGALRFVSGSQQSNSYQIRTPVATIGVRGTIFDLYLKALANGKTILVLILVEGGTSMTYGGQVYNLNKPGQALIIGLGQQVQQVTWDSSLFAVVDRMPFPLFGNHWPNDPHWNQIENIPIDRLDQVFGNGGLPEPPCEPYCGEGGNGPILLNNGFGLRGR